MIADPFDALMVTVSPVAPTSPENVGVVSLVMLSDSEAPVSDDARRSGAGGVRGAERSIVMAVGLLVSDFVPSGLLSDEVTCHTPGDIVGMVHEVAEPIV